MTSLDRKLPGAYLPFRHTHDCTFLKGISIPGDNTLQVSVDPVWPHVAKAKYDHARQLIPSGSNQFTKVQVVCQEHASFLSGLPKDFWVWKPFEPPVAQVHGIVPKLDEERHRSRRDPHVRQKPHTGARSTG